MPALSEALEKERWLGPGVVGVSRGNGSGLQSMLMRALPRVLVHRGRSDGGPSTRNTLSRSWRPAPCGEGGMRGGGELRKELDFSLGDKETQQSHEYIRLRERFPSQ